jgi:predicted DNA-binding ribbon-helix-helix protein
MMDETTETSGPVQIQRGVNFDDALWDAIKDAAAEQNITASQFVRNAAKRELSVHRARQRRAGR